MLAGRDKALSDGAYRLLSCLVDWFYIGPYLAEEEFPLPWSLVAHLCGTAKDQSYRRLRELHSRGYLAKGEVSGSPPKAGFRWVFALVKGADSNWRKKAPIDCRKKAPIDCRKKAPDHISNPFGKEKEREERINSAPEGRQNRPQEDNRAAEAEVETAVKSIGDYIKELREAANAPSEVVGGALRRRGR